MSKKRLFHFNIKRAVKRSFVFLLVFSFFLARGGPSAQAADNILYVKPAGTGDCSSWANACTLQSALSNAVPGKQIWVAAGVYTPEPMGGDPTVAFQLKDGVEVYGGFTGNETLLSQRNWTTNDVILSGDLDGDDDGFTNNDENSIHVVRGATGAILDGVTIRGGNANGNSNFEWGGGGMLNVNGSNPTLTNIIFIGNSADYGGGMYNNYNSSPILTNITFIDNLANAGGGGMNNETYCSPILTNVTFIGNNGGGMVNKESSPKLTDVTFNGNTGNYGGGMYNLIYSYPTLTNVTFSGNTAFNFGGGIYNDYQSNPTMTNVTFSDNSATSGGGMYSGSNSTSKLINVTFNGNTADYGGGMYNDKSNPILNSVTFIGNTAGYGGGIYNYNSSNPALSNVTLSGNTAQNGGGIYNSNNSSPALSNVTFSGNTAYVLGGGMYNSDNSSPTLSKSILWGDSGGEIFNKDTSTTTVSFSDVEGGYTGTGNINADPLLALLGNYGGGVQTMALLPGSPAIDAASSNCPAKDARGVTRSSPTCDLGAFESQGFNLTKTGGDSQNALIYSTFAQSLCVTVTAQDTSEPVNGGKVTFTPPAIGASANLTGSPATITNGTACANAVANGNVGGPYNIVANAAGAVNVIFSLTNTPPKVYLPLINK